MTAAPLDSPTDATRSAVRGLVSAALALVVTAFEAALLAAALGSPAALAAHRPALALVLVWAVGGVVLALVRPVRTHDPVKSDRESPALLIGLALLPLLTAPIGALGERFGVLAWFAHPAVAWAGVGAAALGLGIRIVAMASLGSRFSPLVTVQREHRLETRGLYAVVRHPGYLGALLACAGSLLVFGSGLALPLVLGFAGLVRARIAREERLLETHFGDEYRGYRSRTGALLPRLL